MKNNPLQLGCFFSPDTTKHIHPEMKNCPGFFLSVAVTCLFSGVCACVHPLLLLPCRVVFLTACTGEWGQAVTPRLKSFPLSHEEADIAKMQYIWSEQCS